MKFFYWLTSSLCALFFKLFYGHKVYGASHLPKGSAIIAPNHASYIDPPIIGASISEEVYFLARSSLFEKWGLRHLIENLNAYPVTRSAQDLKSFKIISQLLSENKKIVIFPEGIRTYDNTLGEIKTGVAMLAMRADAPIVPTYIHGAFQIWPRERRLPKLHGKTACVFGSPIFPSSIQLTNKKEKQELITRQLEDSLRALKNWYENGAQGEPP